MSAFEEKVEISHSVLQLHHRVHVPLALADLSSFSLRVSATVRFFPSEWASVSVSRKFIRLLGGLAFEKEFQEVFRKPQSVEVHHKRATLSFSNPKDSYVNYLKTF